MGRTWQNARLRGDLGRIDWAELGPRLLDAFVEIEDALGQPAFDAIDGGRPDVDVVNEIDAIVWKLRPPA